MPAFTMRRTWPDDDRPDDYVFRVDVRDAGRCYAMRAAGDRQVWRWTVYGSPAGEMENVAAASAAQFQSDIRCWLVRWRQFVFALCDRVQSPQFQRRAPRFQFLVLILVAEPLLRPTHRQRYERRIGRPLFWLICHFC